MYAVLERDGKFVVADGHKELVTFSGDDARGKADRCAQHKNDGTNPEESDCPCCSNISGRAFPAARIMDFQTAGVPVCERCVQGDHNW